MSLSHGLSDPAGAGATDASDRGAEGSWITFLSHRSGGNRLYRMRPDGSEVAPIFGGELRGVPGLSEGQTLYRQPHWSRQSPDRTLFLSWTIAPPLSFESLAHAAFDTIRVYGMSNPDVVTYLLKTITDLAPQLHREGDRLALQHHVHAIGEDAERIQNSADRQRVDMQLSEALRALAKE